MEERIAAIWAQALRLECIGVHDDFFELGGHSLLGTQMISQVRETLQVELPLRILFKAPTVARLAEQIELIRWAAQGACAPVPAPGNKREEGEL
jgi:acyl carrier protein